MFNQVSANIAAQQQADLFGGEAEEFALVSQDAKGKDVAVEIEVMEPGYAALISEYQAKGLSREAAQDAADADMLDDFNWVGSRHHY